MARTLPLVTAGYVGSLTNRTQTLALPGKAVWSEESALPFTTTGVAPDALPGAGDPSFTVYFPVDTVISIGPAPNASTGARYFVPAATERSYYAQPGDKLAAVAAV
ncbi:hypothetical protein G6N76_09835 [Rhizobium daejeonense]|uniref:Uncharacterized protein n=1 Tax=Rhizobium daejeonense TaxID=240521 RepID=A0A6M1RQR7_9HYPH|nr:hypothetical protein [Rhizobium daejeonense]NGO63974.1 hypothetical protein [Rhizobium daejeonense]